MHHFEGENATAPSPDPTPTGEGDTPDPTPVDAFGASIPVPLALNPQTTFLDTGLPSMGGRCSVGRVGHGPPKILVGWATMHLAPPIIGLYVR